VALVVAGQPTWLKPADGAPTTATRAATAATAATATVAATTGAAAGARPASAPSPAEGTAPAAPAVPPAEEMAVAAPPAEEMAVAAPPAGATRTGADEPRTPPPADSGVVIGPGMDLPMPDADAGPDAHDRLTTLDLPGTGLGPLREVVEFAAGTQNTVRPRPWTAVRVLVISGAHDGGAAAGVDGADVERRVAQIAAGEGALIRLAGQAGADVTVVRVPASGAMEDGPVLDADAVETALHRGWQLAGAAGDDGRDALVLASAGAGTDAVAAAVLAATTGAEPAAVLPRVVVPGGSYDDHAWMTRCAAVRDALHRIRHEPRGAQDILAQLGGADLAVATGVLLGAAARRIPVLLDGPVGIAAGLIARDLGSQTRHWCLLPDAGTHALVRQGADVLGLSPVLELGLDLGEGANALAVLPLLRAAVGLASALPVHPALLAEPGDDGLGGDDPGDDDADFAEPVPDGPGPTSV
jgi:NaMN:DMB phosphoribosyltransferase